tara:strand:- start:36 stop:842 length:807 start_codon:yes stop_codon:yes gene_type:complete
MRLRFILFFLVFLSILDTVEGQQVNDSINDSNKNNSWHFRISPYFWYVGLKGEIIRPPEPSNLPEYKPPPSYEVDLSFKDISNSLKFFLMLSTTYQGENFVVKAGITSLVLQGEAITPFELISEGINYNFTYLTSEISGGYRIIKKKKVNLDGLIGVRMLYTKIKGSSNVLEREFSGNRSVYWYDPIMGFQLKYMPIKKLEFSLYGDFGPIKKVDSYQVLVQGSYLFTRVFSMSLGYRNYFINSEDDEKDTIYTGKVFGPFLRFGFQF